MRTLADRKVLITGAAAGIGRSMARRFDDEGARLILSDVDEPGLHGTADLVSSTAPHVRTEVLDVTDRDAILSVRQRIHADGGPIDVLVNNAGVVTASYSPTSV